MVKHIFELWVYLDKTGENFRLIFVNISILEMNILLW